MGSDHSSKGRRYVCMNNHSLMFDSSMQNYPTGQYECKLCHLVYPCNTGRYSCGMCHFDICNPCVNRLQTLDPKVYCLYGHLLASSTNQIGYSNGTFFCNLCKRSGPCSNGRWHCEACRYDVCGYCRRPGIVGPVRDVMQAPLVVPANAPAPLSVPLVPVRSLQPVYVSVPAPPMVPYAQPAPQPYPMPQGVPVYPQLQPYERPPYAEPRPYMQEQPYLGIQTQPQNYPPPQAGAYEPVRAQFEAAPYSMPQQPPVQPAPPPRPAQEFPRITDCPNGHSLAFSVSDSGYANGNYQCRMCDTTNSCNSGRFCCMACKYDLCRTCKSD